mmetsp:Transcript_3015/g.9237  ORF Transcript_3015/g.9237 Transcript_3015/m.9237 type:complete len:330 (+) Transcript_3015:135-1124(+)
MGHSASREAAVEGVAVESAVETGDGAGKGDGDSDLDVMDSVQVEDAERFEPPIEKKLGQDVIVAKDIMKVFTLPGRSEHIKALEHISLSDDTETYPIRVGEFVMIRGPSGGGKTTLLNMLGLLDKPSSGLLSVFGVDVSAERQDKALAKLRLEKIGYVFQTFNLMSAMSAVENVELPMMMLNQLGRRERRNRAIRLLESVGLGDRLEHLPSELSGGEQQRVAIARAVANEPKVLLLDEPTGDLDVASTVEVMNLLLDINLEHGTTNIMVTHNPDLECYADRVLYVEDGSFTRQVFNKKQIRLSAEEYAAFLERTERTAMEREVAAKGGA